MPLIEPTSGFDPIQLNGQRGYQNERELYDDFEYNGIGAQFTSLWAIGGTGSGGPNAPNIAEHPGMYRMTASGAVNSFSSIRNADGVFPLPLGYWRTSWIVRVPILSTAAERFSVRCGLLLDAAVTLSGAPTNGIFFEYTDNVNGGRWSANNLRAGALTQADTGVPVVAGTFYQLTAIGAGILTPIQYSIGAAVVATLDTNIPLVNLLHGAMINQTVVTALASLWDIDVSYWGYAFSAFR